MGKYNSGDFNGNDIIRETLLGIRMRRRPKISIVEQYHRLDKDKRLLQASDNRTEHSITVWPTFTEKMTKGKALSDRTASQFSPVKCNK